MMQLLQDPIRVLVIDDDPDHREIMRVSLESCTPPYCVETSGSAADGLLRLTKSQFSLLLLDYNLQETDGLAVLQDLAKRFPRLPTILVTGGGSEEIAAKAMKLGAYDYVVKDRNYAVLLPLVVRDTLERHRLREENQRLQEEIRRRERLLTVNILSAGLAHNIRNPLVTVQTFIEMLPAQLHDPEFLGQYREQALLEVKRISGLVEKLGRYARAEAPRVEATNVGEVLKTASSFLSHESEFRGVRLDVGTQGNLSLRADFQELLEAFTAVFLNALQACKSGGRVRASAREEGAGVRVAISDTGVGIAKDSLPHVFDPFFTSREPNEGVGLGLTIARAIVEQHGGRISIESRPDAGTRVVIVLPRE
jgi:signal transduction histidine kinase